MGARALGQEITVALSVDNVVQKTFSIKSADYEFKGEAVSSDYLGQPGPVFDEVNDGVEIKIEYEPDSPEFFDLLTRLVNRKQGLERFSVNISTRFNFRNGVSRLAVVPNAAFAGLPLSVPGRKEKLKGSMTASAQTVRFPRGT